MSTVEYVESLRPSDARGSATNILVDGYALWIELAQLCTKLETLPNAGPLASDASFTDADVLGGDYWKLSRALTSLVRTLYERYNVRLVFAMDGKQCNHLEDLGNAAQQQADQDREAIRNERERKRQAIWEHLHRYCERTALQKISPHDTRLPAPALCFHQIRCLLQELHAETGGKTAEVIYVSGEVDTEVGVLLRRSGCHFVLTSDTDFCIIAGVRTMLLNDFPLASLIRTDGKAVPVRQAEPLYLRCFTSAKLCESVKVPDVRSVAVATHHHKKTVYRSLSQEELELIASLATNDAPTFGEAANEWEVWSFSEALNLFQKAEETPSSKPTLPGVRAANSLTYKEILTARKLNPYVVNSLSKFRRSITYAEAKGLSGSWKTDELADCQSLPSSLHPLLRYGIAHKERMLFGLNDFLTDLPTFGWLFLTSAALLHKTQVSVYDGENHTTEPEVVRINETILHKVNEFLSLEEKTPQDRHAFLVNLFEQQTAPEAADLFFVSCVLWTMQAGLRNLEELRRMVYTIALTRAMCTNPPKVVAAVVSRLLRTVRAQRPNSRAMEMGYLFTSGFLATYDIFALVYGGTTKSEVTALPLPADVFSGSVLHLVVTADLTSAEKLLRTAKSVNISADGLTVLKTAADTAERLLAPLEGLPFLDVTRFPFQPRPQITVSVARKENMRQNEQHMLRQARPY